MASRWGRDGRWDAVRVESRDGTRALGRGSGPIWSPGRPDRRDAPALARLLPPARAQRAPENAPDARARPGDVDRRRLLYRRSGRYAGRRLPRRGGGGRPPRGPRPAAASDRGTPRWLIRSST